MIFHLHTSTESSKQRSESLISFSNKTAVLLETLWASEESREESSLSVIYTNCTFDDAAYTILNSQTEISKVNYNRDVGGTDSSVS